MCECVFFYKHYVNCLSMWNLWKILKWEWWEIRVVAHLARVWWTYKVSDWLLEDSQGPGINKQPWSFWITIKRQLVNLRGEQRAKNHTMLWQCYILKKRLTLCNLQMAESQNILVMTLCQFWACRLRLMSWLGDMSESKEMRLIITLVKCNFCFS